MPLSPGTRLGPYEVIAAIGAGGMGEVYRARDARLGREVALKMLPDEVAGDAERLARFEREAQVLASLNHRHIAAIYGLEEGPAAAGHGEPPSVAGAPSVVSGFSRTRSVVSDFSRTHSEVSGFSRTGSVVSGFSRTHEGGSRIRALVLELVDGDTLADLIARGPMPVDDAVRLARQIADALEAAHEQGIVHRDLKPANIKVNSAGEVKVLDFGLAKLTSAPDAVGGGSGSMSMSPTMTSPAMLTGATLLLGTASYMAPEQARGKAVDKRADIWAFGVVLFEMLTGRRAFDGESVTEVIGAVIHKDPDWAALPAPASPSTAMIVRRCLQKDPRQRFRDMGDVRLALDGAFHAVAPAEAIAPRRRTIWTAAGLAAIAILLAVVAVLAMRQGGAATPPLVRFEVPALPNLLNVFMLSPDGRHLGMLASNAEGRSGLWVHSFESGQTRELPRAGSIGSMPFWSPDGRFLAYARPDGIYKIDILGGPPERIGVPKERVTHGAWSPSGVIVLGGPRSGLMQLPAGGGEIVPLTVTALDDAGQEILHAGPSFLPDGRRFLYMRISKDPGQSGIYVGSLDAPPDAQPTERVMPAMERLVVYAGSGDREQGHVLFMRDRTLMAQPFDAKSLQLTGEPVLLAENVGVEGNVGGLGLFSASTNGVLAYKHSEDFLRGGTPVWVGQDGTELGVALRDAPSDTLYPQISGDGTRVALVVDNDVWVHHLDGRPAIKLTFEGNAYSPAWSPDGRRLAFEFLRRVHVLPSDGSGQAPEPLTPDGHSHPHGWTKDGRVVVSFDSGNQGVGSGGMWDVGQVSASGGGAIDPIVQTPANEGFTGVALSPDGQWLAYVSNATGGDEIWVRPYAGSGAAVRVSAGGGAMPVWARNGRELYFIAATPDATWRVMAARLEPGPALRFSSPRQLFEASYALGGQPPSYDVAPDGRFLMLKRDSSREAEPTQVILNWQALVEERD